MLNEHKTPFSSFWCSDGFSSEGRNDSSRMRVEQGWWPQRDLEGNGGQLLCSAGWRNACFCRVKKQSEGGRRMRMGMRMKGLTGGGVVLEVRENERSARAGRRGVC